MIENCAVVVQVSVKVVSPACLRRRKTVMLPLPVPPPITAEVPSEVQPEIAGEVPRLRFWQKAYTHSPTIAPEMSRLSEVAPAVFCAEPAQARRICGAGVPRK